MYFSIFFLFLLLLFFVFFGYKNSKIGLVFSFFYCIVFLFCSVCLSQDESFFIYFYLDKFSFIMLFLLVLVLYISALSALSLSNTNSLLVIFCIIFLCCFFVFSTSSLLSLYVNYELSLVPIMLSIVLWGSYPERSLSALILLLYTSFFTFPFLYVLWFSLDTWGTFFLGGLFSSSLFGDSGLLIVVLFFLVFGVNLPIYGLHFWLPIAHVEAPTFGSMLLAGILLKLGGFGLIRCVQVVDFSSISCYFSGYFFVFLAYSTLVCCWQSDFKRLVAYSSVSHMMVIPLLLLNSSGVGLTGILLVMVFHGLSSPLLFYVVGLVYSFSSTRQLFLLRGISTFSYFLVFILIFSFLFTMCIPPFPSFISEVLFFLNSFSLWFYSFSILVIFCFLSLVYNLMWFSSLSFSSNGLFFSYESSFVSYLGSLVMVSLLVCGFVFCGLFLFL